MRKTTLINSDPGKRKKKPSSIEVIKKKTSIENPNENFDQTHIAIKKASILISPTYPPSQNWRLPITRLPGRPPKKSNRTRNFHCRRCPLSRRPRKRHEYGTQFPPEMMPNGHIQMLANPLIGSTKHLLSAKKEIEQSISFW